MKIPISQIKKLRQRTQMSIRECKSALQEAKGDFEKALLILKEKGAEIAEKKKVRETKEGGIGIYLHQNRKIGAMVKLSCETDFVAKNEEFRNLLHSLAMQVAAMDPSDIEELLSQVYIKDVKKTVREVIEETIAKVGENIKIEEFKRFEV